MQFGMLCYWKTHALKNYQENIPFVWNVLSLELIVFGIFKKEKKNHSYSLCSEVQVHLWKAL